MQVEEKTTNYLDRLRLVVLDGACQHMCRPDRALSSNLQRFARSLLYCSTALVTDDFISKRFRELVSYDYEMLVRKNVQLEKDKVCQPAGALNGLKLTPL